MASEVCKTLMFDIIRANLGNAKIEGLEADLGMRGNDYNIANMMFFIPYILCEVPANSILIKFNKASTWIGFIVTAWGIVMTCSGFCQNFGGLVGCRILLGVFEYVLYLQFSCALKPTSNLLLTPAVNQSRFLPRRCLHS